MPKRSIEGFKPTAENMGLGGESTFSTSDVEERHPRAPEQELAHREAKRLMAARVARIIEEAGGLPGGDVKHKRVKADASGWEIVTLPRRKALAERLESAALTFRFSVEAEAQPTAIQRIKRLARIEAAAANLLAGLGVPEDGDTEKMPPIIYRELESFAEEEARRLEALAVREKMQQIEPLLEHMSAEAARRRLDPLHERTDPALHTPLGPGGRYFGRGMMLDAVVGVCRLRDWAAGAKAVHEVAPSTPRDKRHKGDAALDELFTSLIDAWVELFNRKPTISVRGPESKAPGKPAGPFLRFIRACLEPILGLQMLSDGQIRERVRKLRDDNQSRAGRSAPEES
jgi:hypothetical protein